MGSETDEGRILAYGPYDEGVFTSGCACFARHNGLEPLPSASIFSKSGFPSAVTGGLACDENRW
jgi:hypothetical protein